MFLHRTFHPYIFFTKYIFHKSLVWKSLVLYDYKDCMYISYQSIYILPSKKTRLKAYSCVSHFVKTSELLFMKLCVSWLVDVCSVSCLTVFTIYMVPIDKIYWGDKRAAGMKRHNFLYSGGWDTTQYEFFDKIAEGPLPSSHAGHSPDVISMLNRKRYANKSDFN